MWAWTDAHVEDGRNDASAIVVVWSMATTNVEVNPADLLGSGVDIGNNIPAGLCGGLFSVYKQCVSFTSCRDGVF